MQAAHTTRMSNTVKYLNMDSLLQMCVCILLSGTLSCRASSIPSYEVIKNTPKVVEVLQNSPLLLNCTDSMTWWTESGVKYSWFKDGKIVTSDQRVTVSQNGSLYIPSTKKKKRRGWDDEGLYECHMTVPMGTVIGRSVKIKIIRISKSFIKVPKNQVVDPGGVARFECQLKAKLPIQVRKYIWNKNRRQLPANNRYTELPTGVLQIHGVQVSDEGPYSCSVLITLGEKVEDLHLAVFRHSREAELTVRNETLLEAKKSRAPKIVYVNEKVNSTVGSSAILECQADGNPTPTISWQKVNMDDQSKGESVEDGHRVRQVGMGNLKFTKVIETDSGLYRCVAAAPGFNNSSALVTLRVSYPPTLLKTPSSGNFLVANRIRLYCSAQGRPTPSITWYHNGQRLQEDAGHVVFKDNNGQLVIESRVSDSGFYQCIAENPYGSETSTARIQVTLGKNAPSPPRLVEARPVSESQILLSWEPSVCCDVFVYTVHYKWIVPDTNEERSEQMVEQSNQYLVQQLLPYTTYHFYIRAYNSDFSSENSAVVSATTLQSVPSAAPKIQTSSLSVGTITIDWSPLLKSERRGVISRYKIYSRLHGENLQKVEEIHNDTLTYTIKGLLPDRVYSVRVLAGTEVGYPVLTEDKWPWVSQKTLSKDNSSPVIPAPDLEVVPLNNSAVQISWEVSNSSMEARGYQLYIKRKIGPPMTRSIQLPIESNFTVISHLQNRIYYEAVLEVLGENETLGKANCLFQVLSPLRSPEPPPPMDVRVFAKSPQSVSLNWTQPHWEQGISYYTVRYHISNDDRKIMYERSDSQNYTLQDLTPYTTYTISVRSHSPQTTGPFSTPQDITTLEDVPSPPEDVTLYPLSEDEVQLMWNPPIKKNGVIVFYIIQYHQHQNDPDFLWSSIHSNGTMTQAVVKDLTSTVYFFKLRACTTAGQGPPSSVVKVVLSPCSMPCDGRNSSPPVSPRSNMSDSFLRDQRLGIVVGCAIGLTSIIVCILVIVLRQRHYANLYRHSTRTVTNPEIRSRYQQQSYQLPEAHRLILMEGQNKDGGSGGAFLSSTGKLLALTSTTRHTDKLNTDTEQEPGEHACLLWHHQGLHHVHSDGNQSLSNDSGASLSCDIRGVSPESSSERHADSTWGSSRGNSCLVEASGGASNRSNGHENSPDTDRGDNLYSDTMISQSDELLKKMMQATSADPLSLNTDRLVQATSVDRLSLNTDTSCKVNPTSNRDTPERPHSPIEGGASVCTSNQAESTEYYTNSRNQETVEEDDLTQSFKCGSKSTDHMSQSTEHV
ncbi:protogenin-like [Saccostrea echinata]|uniref:protogenin-like n=1 Tax=Saccostrea echinata TaxID=191078 RepID=UPI002A8126E1|nr:protogenin-like [Saccostrea echinata]